MLRARPTSSSTCVVPSNQTVPHSVLEKHACRSPTTSRMFVPSDVVDLMCFGFAFTKPRECCCLSAWRRRWYLLVVWPLLLVGCHITLRTSRLPSCPDGSLLWSSTTLCPIGAQMPPSQGPHQLRDAVGSFSRCFFFFFQDGSDMKSLHETTLPDLDLLNLMQQIQLRCLEDRFLPN